MDAIIIAGGMLDISFLKDYLNKNLNDDTLLIAADRGFEACLEIGVEPDLLIGDFDSASSAVKEVALSGAIPCVKLNPVKDDTDSESALKLAFEKCDGAITFLGATGGRLDHFLGNLALLQMGADFNRKVSMVDRQNRIRLVEDKLELAKESQYGKYVSLMPWGGEASGITLTGFVYPLTDATLKPNCTLGISNEIEKDTALIEVKRGALLVFETKD